MTTETRRCEAGGCPHHRGQRLVLVSTDSLYVGTFMMVTECALLEGQSSKVYHACPLDEAEARINSPEDLLAAIREAKAK